MVAATNAHDLEALVACFAEHYQLNNPLHPARSFTGRDQVRRNWTEIFAAVPDLRCEVLDRVERAATTWLELAMTGTRRDGRPHEMAGVLILNVDADADVIDSARFYLEVVDHTALDADAAVRAVVGSRP